MTYPPLAVSVSELRYRRLFEAAQDGILILDASSARIIDANPFLEELLGYAHDELLGLELWQLGLNGYQVARHIHSQAWGQRMVLIAVTGWGQEEDRQQSKAAGFTMHLVKPVDIEQLMKLLSKPLTEHTR